MVNSSITLADGFVKYQTDVDDPMMAKPGVYKSAIQAYKNSKVCTFGSLQSFNPLKLTVIETLHNGQNHG